MGIQKLVFFHEFSMSKCTPKSFQQKMIFSEKSFFKPKLFWMHFVQSMSEICVNFGSFDTHIALFEENIFCLYLVLGFPFFSDLKCHFRNEPLNIQKNVFNNLSVDFSSGSKST
jgi:hypothetical protein